jgi:hypothetical protein
MSPSSRKKKTKNAKADQSSQPQGERRSEARLALVSTMAYAALGVVFAYMWASTKRSGGDGGVLSSEDILAMVRRSSSFDLAMSNGKRALYATTNIPAGTVLIETVRDLMM